MNTMKILITGGSGFLGRTIMMCYPEHHYVVYSPNVHNQALVREALSEQYGGNVDGMQVRYVVGDIRNQHLLVAAAQGVDAIIHTAAMKYVPEAELNAESCIAVNVQGSMNVIAAALACRVPITVGVSTDKACMPISVYGATKLLMERLFMNAGSEGGSAGGGGGGAIGPLFHTVRFGNFVGSTGSVIPKMLDSARIKGRITITDPFMTRYWMSASQVANILMNIVESVIPRDALVNGSVLIPDLPAMTLAALARTVKDMVAEGVRIEEVGARPGEKTHEMLLCHEESVRTNQIALSVGNMGAVGNMFYEYHSNKQAHSEDLALKLVSNNPMRWLEPHEMVDMVKEAMWVSSSGVPA